jgi:hypothetical protein
MLDSGTRLGPYEIVASIGAGGMGEVYRGRDTRIDRTVAIKVLPSTLAGDPELKQRFEREAKSISSLNHPHICTLYEFDSHEGTDFLVMEHLEGESLAERIARKGALPLDEAIRYAVQIAEALDVAHRQGVIHRDLKPGNIMLTARGAMLLDFGLAKLAEPNESPNLSVLSAVPTQAQPLTEKGAILGTFQYMAPEQLEGKEADARTDVFAFGAVVHEMVTGKKAFEGKSQASLIGAILERDPVPVSSLRPLTPHSLDRIVKKCLAKNPVDRYYSTHDLADELRWLGEEDDSSAVGEGAPGLFGRFGIAVGIVLGALVTGAALWSFWPSTTARQVARFAVPIDALSFDPFDKLALSPDGARFAYVANNQILVRELDALEARPLIGVGGRPRSPAFSPDGQWIAFWDGESGQLKKVAIGGGAPLRLSDIEAPWGITWGEDDFLRFGSDRGIQEVPAGGGTPEVVLETSEPVWRPQRLPDGRSYVFSWVKVPTWRITASASGLLETRRRACSPKVPTVSITFPPDTCFSMARRTSSPPASSTRLER